MKKERNSTPRTRDLQPNSKKVELSLETIAGLSAGQAEAIINAALRSAIRDVEDRGGDDKPRKVTIDLVFQKLGNSVTVEVSAKTSIPPYRAEKTIGDLIIDGNTVRMEYAPDNYENPAQPTLTVSDDDVVDGESE